MPADPEQQQRTDGATPPLPAGAVDDAASQSVAPATEAENEQQRFSYLLQTDGEYDAAALVQLIGHNTRARFTVISVEQLVADAVTGPTKFMSELQLAIKEHTSKGDAVPAELLVKLVQGHVAEQDALVRAKKLDPRLQDGMVMDSPDTGRPGKNRRTRRASLSSNLGGDGAVPDSARASARKKKGRKKDDDEDWKNRPPEIDDAPADGPDMYYLIHGFPDTHGDVASLMRSGVDIDAVVRVSVTPPVPDIVGLGDGEHGESLAAIATTAAVPTETVQVPMSTPDLGDSTPLDGADADAADGDAREDRLYSRLPLSAESLEGDPLMKDVVLVEVTNADQKDIREIFTEMARALYDLVAKKREFQEWLRTVNVVSLPAAEPEADMRHYSSLLESVPEAAVSVPVVLHCMLEQVSRTLDNQAATQESGVAVDDSEAISNIFSAALGRLADPETDDEGLLDGVSEAHEMASAAARDDINVPDAIEAPESRLVLLHKDDSASRRALRAQTSENLAVDVAAVERHMRSFLFMPGVGRNGMPADPEMDEIERGVERTEFRTFTELAPHECEHGLMLLEFEAVMNETFAAGDSMPAAPRGDDPVAAAAAAAVPAQPSAENGTSGAAGDPELPNESASRFSFLDRTYREEMSAELMSQVFRQAVLLEPDIVTSYYPPLDCLLMGVHLSVPDGRHDETEWSSLIPTKVGFAKWCRAHLEDELALQMGEGAPEFPGAAPVGNPAATTEQLPPPPGTANTEGGDGEGRRAVTTARDPDTVYELKTRNVVRVKTTNLFPADGARIRVAQSDSYQDISEVRTTIFFGPHLFGLRNLLSKGALVQSVSEFAPHHDAAGAVPSPELGGDPAYRAGTAFVGIFDDGTRITATDGGDEDSFQLIHTLDTGLVVVQHLDQGVVQQLHPSPHRADVRSVGPAAREASRFVFGKGHVCRQLKSGAMEILLNNGNVSTRDTEGNWTMTNNAGLRRGRTPSGIEYHVDSVAVTTSTDPVSKTTTTTREDLVMVVVERSGVRTVHHQDGTRIVTNPNTNTIRVLCDGFAPVTFDLASMAVSTRLPTGATIVHKGESACTTIRDGTKIRCERGQISVEPSYLARSTSKIAAVGVYRFHFGPGSIFLTDPERNRFIVRGDGSTEVALWEDEEEDDDDDPAEAEAQADGQAVPGATAGAGANNADADADEDEDEDDDEDDDDGDDEEDEDDEEAADEAPKKEGDEAASAAGGEDAATDKVGELAPYDESQHKRTPTRQTSAAELVAAAMGRTVEELADEGIVAPSDVPRDDIEKQAGLWTTVTWPRLFGIRPDGSGWEMLCERDVEAYMQTMQEDDNATILCEPVHGQEGVTCYTYMTKTDAQGRVLAPPESESEAEDGDEDGDGAAVDPTLPAVPQTGMDMVGGSIKAEPEVMEFRQLLVHRQMSVEEWDGLLESLQRYETWKNQREEFSDSFVVPDGRSEEQLQLARQIQDRLDAARIALSQQREAANGRFDARMREQVLKELSAAEAADGVDAEEQELAGPVEGAVAQASRSSSAARISAGAPLRQDHSGVLDVARPSNYFESSEGQEFLEGEPDAKEAIPPARPRTPESIYYKLQHKKNIQKNAGPADVAAADAGDDEDGDGGDGGEGGRQEEPEQAEKQSQSAAGEDEEQAEAEAAANAAPEPEPQQPPQPAASQRTKKSPKKTKDYDVYGNPRSGKQKARMPATYHTKNAVEVNEKYQTVEGPVKRQLKTSSAMMMSSGGPMSLSGQTAAGLRLTVKELKFGSLMEGATYRLPFSATNVGIETRRFKIKAAESRDLKIIYMAGPVAPGMTVKFEAQLIPTAAGEFRDSIALVTETEVITVPVVANVLTRAEHDAQLQESGLRTLARKGVRCLADEPLMRRSLVQRPKIGETTDDVLAPPKTMIPRATKGDADKDGEGSDDGPEANDANEETQEEEEEK